METPTQPGSDTLAAAIAIPEERVRLAFLAAPARPMLDLVGIEALIVRKALEEALAGYRRAAEIARRTEDIPNREQMAKSMDFFAEQTAMQLARVPS